MSLPFWDLLLLVPLNDIASGEDARMIDDLQGRFYFNVPTGSQDVLSERCYEAGVWATAASGYLDVAGFVISIHKRGSTG
jgi:hypothetical protein